MNVLNLRCPLNIYVRMSNRGCLPEYMQVYNHYKPSNLVLSLFLEGKVSIFWLSLIVQHLGTHFGSGIYDHLWLTLTCMYTCEIHIVVIIYNILFLLKILFIWEREGVRGRDRGRSQLPDEQGAWCGAPSQDPKIMTWVEGRCLTNRATQTPHTYLLTFSNFVLYWS